MRKKNQEETSTFSLNFYHAGGPLFTFFLMVSRFKELANGFVKTIINWKLHCHVSPLETKASFLINSIFGTLILLYPFNFIKWILKVSVNE